MLCFQAISVYNYIVYMTGRITFLAELSYQILTNCLRSFYLAICKRVANWRL